VIFFWGTYLANLIPCNQEKSGISNCKLEGFKRAGSNSMTSLIIQQTSSFWFQTNQTGAVIANITESHYCQQTTVAKDIGQTTDTHHSTAADVNSPAVFFGSKHPNLYWFTD